MELIPLAILGLIIIGAAAVIVMEIRKHQPKDDQSMLEWLRSTADGQRAIGQRLDTASTIIGALQKELGSVTEASRGAKELLEMLRSPKLRGGMGEESLEAILASFLPHDLYQMQYRMQSGEIVDAVIKLPWGVIPIDAKFPKENVERHLRAETEEEQQLTLRALRADVKKHIDDISKKYLRPEEGVKEDALMFIPFDAIYHLINS
ncbi:DNA recombination protein RmuC, partial [Candidatus Berkelbacteria bacterium]|nr:DNA recombination protein RmuC [Candidatus Berkelbacteria bacterium]